jgi:hypothetical protein
MLLIFFQLQYLFEVVILIVLQLLTFFYYHCILTNLSPIQPRLARFYSFLIYTGFVHYLYSCLQVTGVLSRPLALVSKEINKKVNIKLSM